MNPRTHIVVGASLLLLLFGSLLIFPWANSESSQSPHTKKVTPEAIPNCRIWFNLLYCPPPPSSVILDLWGLWRIRGRANDDDGRMMGTLSGDGPIIRTNDFLIELCQLRANLIESDSDNFGWRPKMTTWIEHDGRSGHICHFGRKSQSRRRRVHWWWWW